MALKLPTTDLAREQINTTVEALRAAKHALNRALKQAHEEGLAVDVEVLAVDVWGRPYPLRAVEVSVSLPLLDR